MTQPPPYGSPPPYPTSGAPQQPDPWGPQQPAPWNQPPQDQWGQPPSGQWGQPGQWGQQPPGQWGQQPPGQWGQQPQTTNGFAIASLIFGVLGGILLSVIFGFVALSQIRRRGQSGKGLAIAGISLSGAWVLVIVAVAVVGALSSGTDPDGPTLADSGDVDVQELAPGQCINGLKEGRAIGDLPAVACTEPHEAEVFAVFELPGGGFPGDQEVAKLAEDGCVERLDTHAPKVADDPSVEVYFLHPTRTSWRLGDHSVACVAMSSTGKVTGSIQD
ncbi:DUF4190 domain-containing protein [Phytohabitans sp. ZYX-F-186]|uniref:DUF4190 domain-containing protein n=1 Tax=Phytohabitans maris TaxID=3071409 RepID=A0ABU0ZM90_9ACTN|nr:DUF4190 domain-containing protein [Phytohabitans sp. ZYX-F-186]MDQ7908156.1 DUF4190 domain-containing protein [Phytohabitans sp. ZYX-F-186]